MSAALVTAFQEAAQVFLPPPALTVDEWADTYRHLSSVDSAEQGQWRTERAPYLRGIMRAFSDPEIQGVVVKASAQTGKTSCLGNVVGYFIHQDPSPIMVVQPTKEDAEDWSKDRFMAGMVEVTPCLKTLISDVKVKGETIVHKRFPGGQLTVAWSNSKSRLASRPIRILLMDEVNKYPTDPGPQGDPCLRAIKRTQTFWNRKWAKFSTPTLAEICEISKSYMDSDQRKYWVPCPDCGEFFVIDFFKNIKWDKSETALDPKYGKHHPETAYCLCLHCGAVIPESAKTDMVAAGEWRAARPGGNVAGFHISELYSTLGDSSWARIVRQFLDCKGKVIALQNFYNEVLGEAFELQGETVEKSSLMNRRENYPAAVPMKVAVLTAGVDVQGDRLEVKVKGWGIQQESWDIHIEQIFGNPATAPPWAKLDEILSRQYRHQSGIDLGIICTMVDSGGHHTQQVYNFCKSKLGRWIFACKGRANLPGQPLPIVSRPTDLESGVKLWNIGVDTAKALIYSRLKLTEPGQGYYHYPVGDQWDEEHFAQVTAEKATVVSRDFRPRVVWSKMRERNEALDCFDEETEVLADCGWRKFPELTGNERLATVNMDRDDIEYQFPSHLIGKEYVGEMLHIKGHRIDIMTTPQHRMVASKKRQEYISPGVRKWNLTPPYEIVLAKDLTIHHTLKMTSTWRGIPCADDDSKSLDLAEITGWYVAEGHRWSGRSKTQGNLRYKVIISQKAGEKQDHIRELLRRLGWAHHVSSDRQIVITNKSLYCLFSACGDGARNKRVPQWIRDASPNIIRRFLDGAIAGDGWTQGNFRTYATISKLLADDIQELFIKTGVTANVKRRTGGKCSISSRPDRVGMDQFHVSECKKQRASLDGGENGARRYIGENVLYYGRVYCATVPNGTLICRRNGKAFIAGNCEVYSLAALEARRVDLVAAHANLLKSAALETAKPEPEQVIVGAPPEPPARTQQPGRQFRGRSGFVNNW